MTDCLWALGLSDKAFGKPFLDKSQMQKGRRKAVWNKKKEVESREGASRGMGEKKVKVFRERN